MSSGVNWLLVVGGAILILIEVLLGAATGFDFLLIGAAILLGGVLGLLLRSAPLGFAAAGVLSLLYILVGRRRIRSRLMRPGISSNTDALLEQTGVVVEPIGPDRPGRIKLEGDEWRAVLDESPESEKVRLRGTIPPGARVRVVRIDGVTIHVMPVTDTEGGTPNA